MFSLKKTHSVEIGYMVRSLLTNTGRFNVELDSRRAPIPNPYRQQPGECNKTEKDHIVLFEPNGKSSSKNQLENIVATSTVPANIWKAVNVFHKDPGKIDSEQLLTEFQKI